MNHWVTTMNQSDPPAIGTETVDLSLRLREELEQSSTPVGLSELARQFQASKATLHRHLQTLAHHGFVHQDAATLRYAAGIKLFVLGERLRERYDCLLYTSDAADERSSVD